MGIIDEMNKIKEISYIFKENHMEKLTNYRYTIEVGEAIVPKTNDDNIFLGRKYI